MARTISIGAQGFEKIRAGGDFYVDKTDFVRDWWLEHDDVTLVCRPRRFGTLLQIEDKGYVAALAERGIAPGRIRTYGVAFRGKEVLVG